MKYKCNVTSRTLVFTHSHQFESTKSLYKFPLVASNLYLKFYPIGFNQLQVHWKGLFPFQSISRIFPYQGKHLNIIAGAAGAGALGFMGETVP